VAFESRQASSFPPVLTNLARRVAPTASLYAATVARVLPRGGKLSGGRLARADDRIVFVLGSPRSGTTFLGAAIGSLPGFVDLDEVTPLKAALPGLAGLPEAEASRRIRGLLERVRALALVRGLRGVEQTPETAYVIDAALRAYPRARVVHLVRDGRDVVCSLLERGWLSSRRSDADDARLAYGAESRFWVEPERVEEFRRASDATRAAWAWRRYVSAARRGRERTLELGYEEMVADPERTAGALAAHLDAESDLLAVALRGAHTRSIGRWRTELSPEQLADVEREAGQLLRELGYD
jgi:hypothetical protein